MAPFEDRVLAAAAQLRTDHGFGRAYLEAALALARGDIDGEEFGKQVLERAGERCARPRPQHNAVRRMQLRATRAGQDERRRTA